MRTSFSKTNGATEHDSKTLNALIQLAADSMSLLPTVQVQDSQKGAIEQLAEASVSQLAQVHTWQSGNGGTVDAHILTLQQQQHSESSPSFASCITTLTQDLMQKASKLLCLPVLEQYSHYRAV